MSGVKSVSGRALIKPDNADAQTADDVSVALLACGAACPCGQAEIAKFQKHRQRQILVGEGSHGFPKRPARFLVIQRRLCSGHTVILAVMRKVCNGLDQQLIVASDHPLIVHTGRLGNHLAGIFRTKIPLDGLNIALPLTADDGGHRLYWPCIVITCA